MRSMCPGSVLRISQLTADSLDSLISSGFATSPSVSLRWQRGCMTAEETQLVNNTDIHTVTNLESLYYDALSQRCYLSGF